MFSPKRATFVWQTIVIGSTVLPPPGVKGYVRVKMPLKFKLDVQSPKGQNGGKTMTMGRDKADIDIELVYNDAPVEGQEDIDAQDLVEQAIKAMVEEFKLKKALDIATGASYFTETRAMTLAEVSSPEFSDDGKALVKIKGKQHEFKRNAPNVTGTATNAGGTQQWYQDKTPAPGIPLGEWQPVGSVP